MFRTEVATGVGTDFEVDGEAASEEGAWKYVHSSMVTH